MTLMSYLKECFEAGRDENRVNSVPSAHGQDQLKNTGVENNPVIKQSLPAPGNHCRNYYGNCVLLFFLLYCWESQKLSTYHPRTIEHNT